jgi:hypothetical protein
MAHTPMPFVNTIAKLNDTKGLFGVTGKKIKANGTFTTHKRMISYTQLGGHCARLSKRNTNLH